MIDKKIASCLNEWFIRLSQSVNIEYIALVDENGKAQVSAGKFGPINRDDAEDLLKSYFKQPEHLYVPENVNDVHIIKQGAVECFVTPINGAVQLLAISSIERPSVLIRVMLNEILSARKEIVGIVKNEWNIVPPRKIIPIDGVKQEPTITELSDNRDKNQKIALEELITRQTSGMKVKEARKYWDRAIMDDQQLPGDETSISFNEAKRSGLVPDDKQ